MSDETAKPKRKKPGHMKWYPEKWLRGSLRDELTPAQRGVWADLLCLGCQNDPPGQIDFVSFRTLANSLTISKKLLVATIKDALLNKKIRLIKVWVCPKTGKKFEESELTMNQLVTNARPLDIKKSKVGVPLNAIIFLRWNEWQPEYLWQRPYEKRDSRGLSNDEGLGPYFET